jgi:RNA polymerase sigma factor (sigma-70 family)
LEYIRDLVIQAQNNTPGAVEELMGYYMPLIKSVANKFKHVHDIEDLMQDIQLVFIQQLRAFDPQLSNFGFYIKSTLSRVFYQKYAKFYFENEPLNIEDFNLIDSNDVFSRINAVHDIARAIEQLNDRQKAAIKMYYFMHLSQKQCAEYLAINQSAFSRLITRSIKKLKSFLEM